MIPLPVTFTLERFNFSQVAREGKLAIFRKTKPYPSGFLFETFEVVVIQQMNDHSWPNGDFSPAHEHMPKPEEWGTHGWSLQTLEDAWDKLKSLKD